MRKLYLDVETFSSVDIASAGSYKYIESPDFEILIIGYAVDDAPVKQVDLASGDEIPADLYEALAGLDTLKIAHNAIFERTAFKRIGFNIPAEQWYCTMVKAAYCGLPLALDSVSKVLDLENKKLSSGKLLINYFSKPCKPTLSNGGRNRNMPCDNPEKWAAYLEYNRYDVESEREIYHRLEGYEIPESERKLYVLDQKINDNGIQVDLELANAAIAIDTAYSEQVSQRIKGITGVDNPGSPAQIKKWIFEQTGEDPGSFAKDKIEPLLEKFKNSKDVYEVIKLRGLLSRTSIKKYYAMVNASMSDSRVRGTFQFYGANRTGRWAGRLLQLQNLSKNHTPHIEIPRNLVRNYDLDAVEMLYGDVSDILSQLVRTALVAPDGRVLAVADFSAIEARVISWLANEEWRMNVFHGDGKIYEATGARMFGVPVESITKGSTIRQKSKVAELALGYEGGVKALERMGGKAMGLAELEMKDIVRRWRSANPNIVDMWAELDSASKEACRYRKEVHVTKRNLVISCDDNYMTIQLPSGRKLFYYQPHIRAKEGAYGRPMFSLAYYGTVQATKTWGEIDSYGGKLTENIVQAIARDLLAHSMMQLDAAGFKIVCHIHDECLTEVPADRAAEQLQLMSDIMGQPPTWASDLPLRADGYTTPFYLKD